MARILALSSQVARGHVGLSAMVPALQRLGHDVIALPTVLLSNHPGHARSAGMQVPPDKIREMIAALGDNGWLADVDAVVTGYLPTAAHVDVAVSAIARIEEASAFATVIVDPVLGDDPKGLYIEQEAALAIRQQLMPLADVATPNRFELSWLTGCEVASPADAALAGAMLAPTMIVATSVPVEDGRIGNVLVSGSGAVGVTVSRRETVPHGTGDLLAGLVAGYLRSGAEVDEALAKAVAGVEAAVAASAGSDELALPLVLDLVVRADALPLEVVA